MIILFCYYHIVQAIFAHEKALREQAKKMNVTSLRSNADQNAQSAEMRIAKVAMLNISLWVVMWTPYVVICLQGIYGNQDKITPLVTVLPAIIAKASSISNPIIYAISHPKYRLVSKSKAITIIIFSKYLLKSVFFRLRHYKNKSHGFALMRSNKHLIINHRVQERPQRLNKHSEIVINKPNLDQKKRLFRNLRWLGLTTLCIVNILC